MLNISAIVAGVAFVTLAAINVVVMLEASHPSRNGTTRARLIALHRASGYLFVIFFCIMAYIMSQRLAGSGLTSHLPTHLVLHIVLALVLVPLLLLKILIARRYKHSHSLLKALGITIFLISFVLVSIPAFSELIRSASPGSLGLRLATGLAVVACVVQCALVFKKRNQSHASADSSRIGEIPAPASELTHPTNVKDPMNLLLAQTTQQTHDTKTLRFQIPKERQLFAKPGQFLTFQWVIDGQRVTRSYTISSSPLRENYVEITPKRVENGRVSIFLNDRAKPGLTVEASGPYGAFYFDDTLHKSIVLIAAGSGITPMISMLRYINDLELPTPVSLLYCVRTAADIIFQNELEQLTKSLPNFVYEVCLSRPGLTWKGHSGRLTGKFVSQHVIDFDSPTFFLCGPEAFMNNAREILSARRRPGPNSSGEFWRKETVNRESSTRNSPGRYRRVHSLGEGLSSSPWEHPAGSGRAKQRADSLWLPPGPMRHLRDASSERHRPHGRRSRADTRAENRWLCPALCQPGRGNCRLVGLITLSSRKSPTHERTSPPRQMLTKSCNAC